VDQVATSEPPDLYERDEHAWIAAQVAALREGRLADLDRDNLVDLLDAMARSNRHELRSRLTVLLQHLLKARFQPARMSRSWARTILHQQQEIQAALEDYPSLAREVETIAARAYRDAVARAAQETSLDERGFPPTSPWTVAEALAFEPPPVPPNPFHPAHPRRT
jgi:hypothetical protein